MCRERVADVPPFISSMLLMGNNANHRYLLASASIDGPGSKNWLAGYPSGYPRTKSDFVKAAKSLKTMVGDTGIEPVTPRV